jgi:hypothetical protein
MGRSTDTRDLYKTRAFTNFTRDASLWCCLDLTQNGHLIPILGHSIALAHPTRHYFLILVACMCTYTWIGEREGGFRRGCLGAL